MNLHQRHQQHGGVEHVGVVVLDERAALGVPAALHDLAVDRVAGAAPAWAVGGESALVGDPEGAFDRDPAHQPGVGEVLAAAAGLPDALVGLVPVLADPVDDPGEVLPGVVVDRGAVLVVEVDGVDQLAVDVELELVGGAVADPHRRRAAVALEVVEHLLGELGAAVDPVHDLQRARLAGRGVAEAVGEPVHERRRLLGEPEAQQGVEGERGVADPGVAVVPVALAAELLGQAGGRGGDDRAGRLDR